MLNKQTEIEDGAISYQKGTACIHTSSLCKSHRQERLCRTEERGSSVPEVTQRSGQKRPPPPPPIAAGCSCSDSHQCLAFTRQESSANGCPASPPRQW